MGFVLYDDATARGFAPFALTRPAGELRAGAELVRTRWSMVFRDAASGFLGAPHLTDFEEFDAPRAFSGVIPAGTWIVNARCAPALDAVPPGAETRVLRCGGRVAAVRLTAAIDAGTFSAGRIDLAELASGADSEIAGWWIDAPWDLVGHLPAMLLADVSALLPSACDARGASVLGPHGFHVEPDAVIEPMVVVDATAGPVLIRRGAHIQAFTRRCVRRARCCLHR